MSTDHLDSTDNTSGTEGESSMNLANNGSTQDTSSQNISNSSHHKLGKKFYMVLATIVFIIAFIAFGIYWLLVLRFQQYTDDAYVAGMQVPIIAQTQGNVIEVFFDNTDLVSAGDIMVVLDNTNATLAFESAKHELASAVRQIQTLYQENIGYKATVEEQRILLVQAEQDYKRRIALGNGAISREALQHAAQAVASAKAALEVATQQLRSNEAALLDTEPSQQPAILVAADQVRQAWINLQRTVIRSPVTGYVARRNVQIGSEVSPSTALMVVVPTEPMWVDANFKETQLADIRIGQPVSITSDIYGSNVVYDGVITGLDMGTGSAFSLLPAQNATGNWIKIIQRLPVRIDLKPEQVRENPLRIGLSMNVTVDIKDTSGAVLEVSQRTQPAFKSDVLILNLEEVNRIIEGIITENSYLSLEEK